MEAGHGHGLREVVLEASGLLGASSAPALEAFLRRHSGIHHAAANYLNQTVTVGYDESLISEAEIRRLIEECGYHCRGEALPRHVCAPEPGMSLEHRAPKRTDEHAGHAMTLPTPTHPPEHGAHGGAAALEPGTRPMEH